MRQVCVNDFFSIWVELLLSLLCLFTVSCHVTSQSGGTIGLTLLTVTGSSFDTSGLVTIGTLPCLIQTWSAQSIVCQSPPGQGLYRVIQVTTVHNSSNTFGYIAPAITSMVINECLWGGFVIRYDHPCYLGIYC